MRHIIEQLMTPRIDSAGVQRVIPVAEAAAKLILELHGRLQYETQARVNAEKILVESNPNEAYNETMNREYYAAFT